MFTGWQGHVYKLLPRDVLPRCQDEGNYTYSCGEFVLAPGSRGSEKIDEQRSCGRSGRKFRAACTEMEFNFNNEWLRRLLVTTAADGTNKSGSITWNSIFILNFQIELSVILLWRAACRGNGTRTSLLFPTYLHLFELYRGECFSVMAFLNSERLGYNRILYTNMEQYLCGGKRLIFWNPSIYNPNKLF